MQSTNTNSQQNHCYCGSELPFEACCQPFITGLKTTHTAEFLMRSRYSAYASKQFSYIIDTYGKTQRSKIDLLELEQAGKNSHWLKLEVIKSTQQTNTAQVEFSAYYQIEGEPEKRFYKLHELSDFCQEDGQWRYITGKIFDDSGLHKQQRNEMCLCSSGKKFKKCCGA